ncbi:DHHC palmitoyltransferase-domain-containing protein [Cyathus striatus]|nr:DHHC palmitoyltransferase-domain-containing protein [Cyathus striatus]
MPPRRPLLSFSEHELQSRSHSLASPSSALSDTESRKRWYHFLPLCATLFFILAPQPSLFYVLIDFHLLTLRAPIIFTMHMLVTCTLTFMLLSSLMVCTTRDPGPVNVLQVEENEDMSITEALMPDIDFDAPGKWCRKCWAPKPERAHHCSFCGRCVLKLVDHHCPWLGSTCIGHRTYPAFVHFLTCVTLLSLYVAIISILALMYAFNNPLLVNEFTPVHELVLCSASIIATLVIGPFAIYHLYLVSTNQTTLEHISPFMLLRHLPRLPPTGHSLSDPPLEPELSYTQRCLVKDAHGAVRIYDIGWRKNWTQVFGWNRKYGWVYRLWFGGASAGDGKVFPRNPRTDEMLARLASELVKADRYNQ